MSAALPDAAVDAARRTALRLLARRAHARAELRVKLERRHSRTAVGAVLDEFAARGWLDDEAFARDAARTVLERGPASVALLEARLAAHGIDTALAARVAAEAVAEGDSVEDGVTFARRRLRTLGGLAPAAAAGRIGSALARRGLDADTIATVLRRLGLPAEP